MKSARPRELSLDGTDWQAGRVNPGGGIADIEAWYPSKVPGNVQLDLINAGILKDPFYGLQNEAARWVEKYDWWYRRKITLEPAEDGRRTILVFNGIDYESDLFFNGRKVGSHVGMFSPVIVDVTRRLECDNTLCVRIASPSKIKDRIKTQKCQMSFGWDFAPTILTIGIWDHAYIIRPFEAYLKNIVIDPSRKQDGAWEVSVGLEIDDASAGEAEIEYTVAGANFDTGGALKQKQLVVLRQGINTICTTVTIDKPRLWEMWEEGKQNLYLLNVSIKRGGKVLDTGSSRFGLRTVQLLPNEDNPSHLWTFEINGRNKFIRGANWVPADSYMGRLDAERYRGLLEKVREANMNMLRVWGGGLREKQEFYDICDELGILVWQEFPFACPNAPYPRSESFLRLAGQEAKAIALAGRNHPSVVMFCGGNEFSASFNPRLIETLKGVVEKHGGARPFKPTSPTVGEHHRYIVHHALGNVSEYLQEDCSFFSEFGMQSVPDKESLCKFIPEENLWPVKPRMPYSAAEFTFTRAEQLEFLTRLLSDSQINRNAKVWAYHSAQLMKIDRYAKEAGYHDLDSFIEATQKMQAHGLQVAIEHIRRRRMKSSGVMFWQLNEPWPAISWSVLDYYLRPKLAYYKVKEVYNPLLPSLMYDYKKYSPGDTLEARVFIINDRRNTHKNAKLHIRMVADGKTAWETNLKILAIEPDSVAELDSVSVDISGRKTRTIECTIEQSGKILSRNSYDLTIHDSKPTPAIFKLGFQMMEKFFWS